jgi:hypothetical protein
MTPWGDNPFTVVADVGDALDAVGARYVVVGSLASSTLDPTMESRHATFRRGHHDAPLQAHAGRPEGRR